MSKKKRNTLIKLIIVAVLVLIIVLTFKDSAGAIWEQLKNTAPFLLVMIFLSSVIYHFFEGSINWVLMRKYNPNYKLYTAVYFAFYCSFYRVSTLGSGQGVAAVVFLGKHGVDYSKATGIYTIQFMLHRSSIALFSVIFMFISWDYMSTNFHEYIVPLVFAYILTGLICAGLILFVCARWFHRLCLWLLRKLNGKMNGKLDKLYAQLQESCVTMGESSKKLLGDAKLIVLLVVINLIKLAFWYSIPYLVLFQTNKIPFLHSLAITSLSVMSATVIPTPAGIGSTELVMTGLLGVVTGMGKASATALLYRAATFIFPFITGAIMMGIMSVVSRTRRK